jgi:hypothetical protein
LQTLLTRIDSFQDVQEMKNRTNKINKTKNKLKYEVSNETNFKIK